MCYKKVFSGNKELQIYESEWADFSGRYLQVEAAGGLVKNGKGEYLMIFRNGRWDLPKGKREEGESMEQTAIREVMEECGIDAPTLQGLLTVTYHTYTLQGVDILKHTCWYAMTCAEKPGKLQPQLEEGVEAVAFVPPEKVADCVAAGYPSIKEVFVASGYYVA
ncbi:MAG: NUDIX domain-containing protein [Prevotellaceae bacterium]|jgi:8-oxo-dGTP pyrophosphatase MutT (NUDIX family)|nr:NUDIX domain-containing protein [Prevotellaceae bacterium]